MMKSFRVGAAAVALMLALGSPAEAQLTPASGGPDCLVANIVPGFSACRGSFEGNNLGNGDPGATNTINFINSLWGPGFAEVGGDETGWESSTGSISWGGSLTEFVIALKAGPYFSLYYFDGSEGALSGLNYDTSGTGLNPQGKALGLSHYTLYAGDPVTVPEPGTMLLLGTGLLGMVAVRRRREDLA